MNQPDASFQTIPFRNLPEGFARRLDDPPDPPPKPRPAATVVILRPTSPERGEGPPSGSGREDRGEGEGLEVLLLRRDRSMGFVPGAYVFPGGRVDPADGSRAVVERLSGISPEDAAARLRLSPDHRPPPIAYYVAALRETFEETGILLAKESGLGGREVAPGGRDLTSLLDEADLLLDAGMMEYVAHWVTPEVEPRRYDTRFFALQVDRHRRVEIDRGEIVDALWLTPGKALRRHREGRLPMIFPTLHTVASLRGYRSPQEALRSFGGRPVPTIVPRLMRTEEGLRMELPGRGEGASGGRP